MTCDSNTMDDPFKNTSSVSLNPIIKFSTLFGLLAAEIAIEMAVHTREANPGSTNYASYIAVPLFIVGLIFVWRSFYKMRIPKEKVAQR